VSLHQRCWVNEKETPRKAVCAALSCWLQQLWPCPPMVPMCPYVSLVPSNASKSLVKLHTPGGVWSYPV